MVQICLLHILTHTVTYICIVLMFLLHANLILLFVCFVQLPFSPSTVAQLANILNKHWLIGIPCKWILFYLLYQLIAVEVADYEPLCDVVLFALFAWPAEQIERRGRGRGNGNGNVSKSNLLPAADAGSGLQRNKRREWGEEGERGRKFWWWRCRTGWEFAN